MANKVIHICDRCKSYIDDDKDVWPITLLLALPSARNAYSQTDMADISQSGIVYNRNIQREICTRCAKEVNETYMLAEKNTADKLFDGFKPPVTNLEEEIKNYHDEGV